MFPPNAVLKMPAAPGVSNSCEYARLVLPASMRLLKLDATLENGVPLPAFGLNRKPDNVLVPFPHPPDCVESGLSALVMLPEFCCSHWV